MPFDQRLRFRVAAHPLRAAALLLSFLLPAACGGDAPAGGAGRGAGGGPGGEAQTVTTQVVQPRAWNDVQLALGTVRARESVTVTAKVNETVQRVHFESGDRVERGAPLVTLSGQAQQAELAAAQATAAEAEQLFRRQESLAAQQLIARSQLDTQRATRDAARAQVAQVRAALADRVIRAPFAGVLGIRQVSPGSLVQPGTAIATLDDVSRVFVDFPVPELRLASLAPGQRVVGRSEAFPGEVFEGTVTTVEARVDPATRAVTVRGEFANPERRLRPGMLLNVQLQQPERQALLVPEIAVVQVGSETYVFRVKQGDTVERADVRIGTRRDGLAEIVSGLAAGDRIVVDGTGKLRPGAKIAEAPAAPRPAPRGAAPEAGDGRAIAPAASSAPAPSSGTAPADARTAPQR